MEEETTVTAHVEVEMVNYAVNPGFEDKNRSMWKVSYEALLCNLYFLFYIRIIFWFTEKGGKGLEHFQFF